MKVITSQFGFIEVKIPSVVNTEDFQYYYYSNINQSQFINEVEKKGWIFKFVNFPIFQDPLYSALQAKYIKYLQNRNEYEDGETIIHLDSKLNFDLDCLITAKDLNVKNILMTKHWFNNSLLDEIVMACDQERYKRYMRQTCDFITNFEMPINYNKKCNQSGFIIYNINKEVRNFCDDCYTYMINLHQPEDQIFMNIFNQKYRLIETSDIFNLDTNRNLTLNNNIKL